MTPTQILKLWDLVQEQEEEQDIKAHVFYILYQTINEACEFINPQKGKRK